LAALARHNAQVSSRWQRWHDVVNKSFRIECSDLFLNRCYWECASAKKLCFDSGPMIDLARKQDRHTNESRYPESFFARIPATPMVTSLLR
jgi:hypothetical protein